MTLDYFRVQQQKVAAFASGMHSRLGAASGVSWLDEQALVIIADEVLSGWGLLKEWRQELSLQPKCEDVVLDPSNSEVLSDNTCKSFE